MLWTLQKPVVAAQAKIAMSQSSTKKPEADAHSRLRLALESFVLNQ